MKYTDVMMAIYNLIEYSNNHLQTSGSFELNNCAPFTHCLSKINNRQIDKMKYIDVMMPIYKLIAYSNEYSK